MFNLLYAYYHNYPCHPTIRSMSFNVDNSETLTQKKRNRKSETAKTKRQKTKRALCTKSTHFPCTYFRRELCPHCCLLIFLLFSLFSLRTHVIYYIDRSQYYCLVTSAVDYGRRCQAMDTVPHRVSMGGLPTLLRPANGRWRWAAPLVMRSACSKCLTTPSST